MPDDWLAAPRAAGRRRPAGDAVKMFMRFVGTPAVFTAVMPLTPVWRKLKAVAPTLPYDITILHDHQRGPPLTAGSGPRSRSRRWSRPAARARPG